MSNNKKQWAVDKAKELIDKMTKQYALIAVNEIINSMPTYPIFSNPKLKRTDTIIFWIMVKEEILTYGGNND